MYIYQHILAFLALIQSHQKTCLLHISPKLSTVRGKLTVFYGDNSGEKCIKRLSYRFFNKGGREVVLNTKFVFERLDDYNSTQMRV